MAGWLTGISSKLDGLLGGVPPAARLGAFGKHPAWNDHMDDLALDSEGLLAAKRYLYLYGIGKVIDSGQWDSLPPDAALPEFSHSFFWLDAGNCLAGRIWSSMDGKDRPKYPMIACVHIAGRTGVEVPEVLPVLEDLERACRADVEVFRQENGRLASTQEEVRDRVAKAKRQLLEKMPLPAAPGIDRNAYAASVGLAAGAEAARRIAYAAESYLTPSATDSAAIDLKLEKAGLHTQHLRLPAAGSARVSLQFWRAFLARWLPSKVPQLYIVPDGAGWLDLIAGFPTEQSLLCLKSGTKPLPVASQIAFELSETAKSAADVCWQEFLKAE